MKRGISMNKSIKRLVLVSTLTVTAFVSNSVLADVTANVGVTSNYLWRGVTQSGDLSAISDCVLITAMTRAFTSAPGPLACLAASMNWISMEAIPGQLRASATM
jgi:hypothetical protein